jgi:hypothetical protein
MDSPYNTSLTTASWNRGTNKRHENALTAYARGDQSWSDLPTGAQRRFFQQAEAWKDLRHDMKHVAPALSKDLDRFYMSRKRSH